jgi:hypothetical protein
MFTSITLAIRVRFRLVTTTPNDDRCTSIPLAAHLLRLVTVFVLTLLTRFACGRRIDTRRALAVVELVAVFFAKQRVRLG